MYFCCSPYMLHAPSPQFTLRLMICAIFLNVFWSCNQPGQVGFVVKIWETGNETSDFKKGNPWPESDVLKMTWRHEVWYGPARLISPRQPNTVIFPYVLVRMSWRKMVKLSLGRLLQHWTSEISTTKNQYEFRWSTSCFCRVWLLLLSEFWQKTIRIWRMANLCSYQTPNSDPEAQSVKLRLWPTAFLVSGHKWGSWARISSSCEKCVRCKESRFRLWYIFTD